MNKCEYSQSYDPNTDNFPKTVKKCITQIMQDDRYKNKITRDIKDFKNKTDQEYVLEKKEY